MDVILLGWSSSKVISGDLALHPGWVPWLLIQSNSYFLRTTVIYSFSIWTKFGFILSKVMKKKDFQRFTIFNQSEAMEPILDARQGHQI
jgi:hypothetical protein